MRANDKQKQEILNIKRFGYVISAIFIIISNLSLINKWSVTPILFLITMYFLTAALWIPVLIKPFYKVFTVYFARRQGPGNHSEKSEDYFRKN